LSEITSDILALSFDSLSSPSIKLKLQDQFHGTHPLGWGVAWYPSDNQASIVSKDPLARDTEVRLDALTDWNNYRSTVFFCKVKGAAKGYTYHETQPFSRSFAGQDWLFMHNGDLDKVKLAEMHGNKSRFLEPLGKTDSELAFCYLLGKVQETAARKLADVPNERLLHWFKKLDALGSADMCISDGVTLICFYGTGSSRKLYYSRYNPPSSLRLNSEVATLDLNDPRDNHRTSLIISSSLFNTGDWHEMRPGQMLVVRRGALVWDSMPDADSLSATQPPAPTQPAPHPQNKVHRSVVNIRSITRTEEGQPLGYRTFDITHRTEYNYGLKVEHSTHTFRLQPLEDQVQEVVNATVAISCEGEEIRYEDVFSNPSIYYRINTPYNKLVIESTSRVKLYAMPPDDHSLSQRQSSIPLVWMPWQRQMMTPYLLPTELPETQLRELTDYGMSFVRRNDYHLMNTLKDINLGIYRDYKYMPGTTSLHTTPFEVYVSRQGVCQDFANLFICIARLLSIPARYRMGYIFTGANYANKIQSDASHAWVEIYIPYVGWRGFDPTNGCMVSQDHVRVACGRNYGDSTPTSGTIFKGGGIETLNVSVKMDEVVG
jgi:transglutaminase-like putative cysteine protease/predicted glutamine amidotransferase